MRTQQATLRAVLGVLKARAPDHQPPQLPGDRLVLDELAARPIKGAVLHWWLGDARRNTARTRAGLFLLSERIVGATREICST